MATGIKCFAIVTLILVINLLEGTPCKSKLWLHQLSAYLCDNCLGWIETAVADSVNSDPSAFSPAPRFATCKRYANKVVQFSGKVHEAYTKKETVLAVQLTSFCPRWLLCRLAELAPIFEDDAERALAGVLLVAPLVVALLAVEGRDLTLVTEEDRLKVGPLEGNCRKYC